MRKGGESAMATFGKKGVVRHRQTPPQPWHLIFEVIKFPLAVTAVAVVGLLAVWFEFKSEPVQTTSPQADFDVRAYSHQLEMNKIDHDLEVICEQNYRGNPVQIHYCRNPG
jgi:hypothetical protein